MDLLSRFVQHVEARSLFLKSDRLLLAVSGGLDSSVMVELCLRAGYSFSIAHCNFQLRDKESGRDEQFVKELAEKNDIPFFSIRFDTSSFADKEKISIQEAARALRYQWFNELISSGMVDAKYILTAHHADDNVETVAMLFFRGTGLHGLTGIPDKKGKIRRPLLEFTRAELEAFAKDHHLEHVEDASNASLKYTRNFFRNEILPAISKIYPQVMQNLRNNITRFSEIESLYKISTGNLLNKLCRKKGEEVHVPIKQLLEYKNNALIFELISPYGFSPEQVSEVVRLCAGDSGSYIQEPGNRFRIIRHRHWLIIAPVAHERSAHFIIEGPGHFEFPGGVLEISRTNKVTAEKGSHLACLDAKAIQFPLLLRKWKTGDYFYPLGMKKKKKIARFLIDQKLSATDKEKVWVIESNNRIIWIVNHRIDERFKISGNTKEMIRLMVRGIGN